ncbi:MAG: hypothetical protein QNJ33_18505 [Crocosphaera sp.]|nr:hypothetical protein [Crocosphaera sp.]
MSDSSTATSSIVELLEGIEDKIDKNHKELKEEIKQVNQKLDTIDKRITTLEIKQVTLIVKVEGIDKMLQNVDGTQKNQIWALIFIVSFAAAILFLYNP